MLAIKVTTVTTNSLYQEPILLAIDCPFSFQYPHFDLAISSYHEVSLEI